jgi:hypothetical protein
MATEHRACDAMQPGRSRVWYYSRTYCAYWGKWIFQPRFLVFRPRIELATSRTWSTQTRHSMLTVGLSWDCQQCLTLWNKPAEHKNKNFLLSQLILLVSWQPSCCKGDRNPLFIRSPRNKWSSLSHLWGGYRAGLSVATPSFTPRFGLDGNTTYRHRMLYVQLP